MAPVEDNNDSGMESQESSAAGSQPTEKDDLPTSDKPKIEMDYDDQPDETLAERLWGLTEMFPERVRNITYSATTKTKSGIQSFYSFSRNAIWIVCTTSLIVIAPLVFEVERVGIEESLRTQQKQMLLGPNTAVSGSGSNALMPPLQR